MALLPVGGTTFGPLNDTLKWRICACDTIELQITAATRDSFVTTSDYMCVSQNENQ
jgi:hypothetical protein